MPSIRDSLLGKSTPTFRLQGFDVDLSCFAALDFFQRRSKFFAEPLQLALPLSVLGKSVLDDLVASGINAYHPVERAAGMDLGIVKEKYRGKLCLVGNVNNKTTLATGTLEEVERETIECLREGAPGGGYILAADHSLHDGQQVQNILKMIETAKKYGEYPLNLPNE